MFSDFDKYLAVFLTALLVTYLLTPAVRALTFRLGMVDLPNERRPHRHPTARGGGLAVVIGVHAACVVALFFDWPALAGGLDLDWWRHFLLGSLILLVIGFIDDSRQISPPMKLGGQTAAALVIAFGGNQFGTLFGFELSPAVDFVLVVLWILLLINAFNLIDGLDGLASGLAIISAIGLCGVFYLNRMPGDALVLLGLVGACLAFLRYNFHPATIFLGDTGSMFIGFTLATVSLQTFTKGTVVLGIAIPALVLGVPLYDELLAVWRRSVRGWLARKTSGPGAGRKGIMQPDLDHLHHRLVRAGLTTPRVAGFLYLCNAILVAFGLLITLFHSHAAGILLLALLAGAYVVMRHLAVIELRDTGRAIMAGLHRPTHANFKALFPPVWDMVWLCGAVGISMAFVEPREPEFWRSWFLELPIWVTPTFSLLAASRIYVTFWSRARTLDALVLASILVVGLLISLAVALLIDPEQSRRWLLRAFVVGGISHPTILLLRVLYRVAEEMVLHLRNRSDIRSDHDRILLYGAGGRCQLYLRERAFNESSSFDGRHIVGLIDDDPSLLGQWVYGYPVLGGLDDLPRIASKRRITGLLVTAGLRPERLEAARDLADEHRLQLTEWKFKEENLKAEA